jgi:hypothetical protein
MFSVVFFQLTNSFLPDHFHGHDPHRIFMLMAYRQYFFSARASEEKHGAAVRVFPRV